MCLDLAQVGVHTYREKHRLRFPNMTITSAGIVAWLTRHRSLCLSYSLVCLGDGAHFWRDSYHTWYLSYPLAC
ncbi:hypothetical protein L211DRAFT_832645, partial [Terfezia boudieri ATCC MYA-4762]